MKVAAWFASMAVLAVISVQAAIYMERSHQHRLCLEQQKICNNLEK